MLLFWAAPIFAEMNSPKLFMILLGASPPGRHTEQHDVFFGIAENLAALKDDILAFWPGDNKIHVDGWREVTRVDGFGIEVVPKSTVDSQPNSSHLFFLNLGGYKKGEFEEFHYKLLTVAPTQGEAIQKAKQTAFYKHTGFKGAPSHVDDKFGVDVDDVVRVMDILSPEMKEKYSIRISESEATKEDEIYLGYFKLNNLPFSS